MGAPRVTWKSVVFEGQGLHTAAPAVVEISARPGPFVLHKDGIDVTRAELGVIDGTRSTTVASRAGAARLATVEHLFAALGGLGIHDGIVVDVRGPELPLLDGAAAAWCRALRSLDAPRSAARLVIAEEGEITVGASSYVFVPGERVGVEVHVDFDDARLARTAAWHGDADDFATRIATARTFGFEHEVEDLIARGLASHVSPEAVVVIGRDRVLCAGAPFTPDEPARHKLLDLVGDLWVHGGPPRGFVRATRPGHAATHAAMAQALERGIVLPSP